MNTDRQFSKSLRLCCGRDSGLTTSAEKFGRSPRMDRESLDTWLDTCEEPFQPGLQQAAEVEVREFRRGPPCPQQGPPWTGPAGTGRPGRLGNLPFRGDDIDRVPPATSAHPCLWARASSTFSLVVLISSPSPHPRPFLNVFNENFQIAKQRLLP